MSGAGGGEVPGVRGDPGTRYTSPLLATLFDQVVQVKVLWWQRVGKTVRMEAPQDP